MLAYRLDKPIRSDILIRDLEKLVSSHGPNMDNKILVITIKTITNTDTNLIPKITYENCTT